MLILASVSADGYNERMSNLLKSGWLKHIKSILEGTNAIVSLIDSGLNILLHCR